MSKDGNLILQMDDEKRNSSTEKENSANIKQMGRPSEFEQNGNNIFDVQRDRRITKQEI